MLLSYFQNLIFFSKAIIFISNCYQFPPLITIIFNLILNGIINEFTIYIWFFIDIFRIFWYYYNTLYTFHNYYYFIQINFMMYFYSFRTFCILSLINARIPLWYIPEFNSIYSALEPSSILLWMILTCDILNNY